MNRLFSRPLVMALTAMCLLAAAVLILAPEEPDIPSSPSSAQSSSSVPQEGAEMIQTIVYVRCGHTVVRRSNAPTEVYGQTLDAVEALYPNWQLTELSARLIKMEKQLPLYCPDHMVLMPDDAGMLCVFQNKYGEAMSMIRELNIPVKQLPAAAQEEVEMGLGFTNAEEMDRWLESVES